MGYSMQAAVLYGKEDVRLESVPVPLLASANYSSVSALRSLVERT